MSGNVLIYILVMAVVTYLIRALPLTLIRRPIRSPFIRSFLYYVPYVTLTVMTIPDILSATGSIWSAVLGLVTALALAWTNRSLIKVSLAASVVVFLSELLLVA